MEALEFEEFVAANMHFTLQEFRDGGRVVLVCRCGEERCLGFVTMLKDQAEAYFKIHPGRYAWPTSPWPRGE